MSRAVRLRVINQTFVHDVMFWVGCRCPLLALIGCAHLTAADDLKATRRMSAFGGENMSFPGPSVRRSLCDRKDLPFCSWRDATPTFDAGSDAENVGNIDDIGRAPLDDGEVDQGV